MRTPARFTAALLLGGFLSTAAAAQGAPPQIPTPANPFPANPVATDGTSLLSGRRVGRVTAQQERYGNPVGGFLALTPRY